MGTTVCLARGDQRGRALVVPVRLLTAPLRDDPVAHRILGGVLAMSARALTGGIA